MARAQGSLFDLANEKTRRIAYGLVVMVVLLALALWLRRQPSLRRFWELAFAFFVLAPPRRDD